MGFENREDVFIFDLQNIAVQSMNKSSLFNAFALGMHQMEAKRLDVDKRRLSVSAELLLLSSCNLMEVLENPSLTQKDKSILNT